MPRSIDWKIGERRRINRDPEYRTLTIEGVRELLSTGDEEDRQGSPQHRARAIGA